VSPPAAATGLEAVAKDIGAQSFWMRRLVALILDALIVGVACFAASLGPFPRGLLELSVIGGLVLYLYTVILEYFTGQTVGKMVMRLRVVGVGAKVDLPALLVREVSKVHGLALLADLAAGMLVETNGRVRYLEVLSKTTEVVEG
jgi:uncharacterized RDD family membrane protein YckC